MEKSFLYILITAICLVAQISAGRDKDKGFKQFSSKCGQVPIQLGSRIVGGHTSEINAWPWMVSIGYMEKKVFEILCGGTVIHKRYVLTAAHCCPMDLEQVRLGHYDRGESTAHVIDIKVSKLICHEQFDIKTYENDVALVRLKKEIQFCDEVRPICLPPPDIERLKNFDGKNLTVAGWGLTSEGGEQSDVLREVVVYGIPLEECKTKHKRVTNTRICAGYPGGGRDACQGDSGGPLMYLHKPKGSSGTVYFQVGIVSSGKGCARPGYYGLYTRLTDYVPWILGKISK